MANMMPITVLVNRWITRPTTRALLLSLLKPNAIPLAIEIVFGSIPITTPINIRNGVIMIPAASPDIDPNNMCLRREYFVVTRPLFDFIYIYLFIHLSKECVLVN
jgi:hypothetical protein